MFKDEGKDVVPGVWEVLDKIKAFSEKVGARGILIVLHIGCAVSSYDCACGLWHTAVVILNVS